MIYLPVVFCFSSALTLLYPWVLIGTAADAFGLECTGKQGHTRVPKQGNLNVMLDILCKKVREEEKKTSMKVILLCHECRMGPEQRRWSSCSFVL